MTSVFFKCTCYAAVVLFTLDVDTFNDSLVTCLTPCGGTFYVAPVNHTRQFNVSLAGIDVKNDRI